MDLSWKWGSFWLSILQEAKFLSTNRLLTSQQEKRKEAKCEGKWRIVHAHMKKPQCFLTLKRVIVFFMCFHEKHLKVFFMKTPKKHWPFWVSKNTDDFSIWYVSNQSVDLLANIHLSEFFFMKSRQTEWNPFALKQWTYFRCIDMRLLLRYWHTKKAKHHLSLRRV